MLPLAANSLRVYGTILAASLGMTQLASGMHHYVFGWVVFALTIWLLFWTCGRWYEQEPETFASRKASDVDEPGTAGTTRRLLVFGAVATLAIGIAPVSVNVFFIRPPARGSTPPTSTTEVAPPWQTSARDLNIWAPHFVAPASELRQTYQSGNHRVKLYVAYYAADQPGVKLAANDNVLFDPTWQVASQGHRTVTVAGQDFEVVETAAQSEGSSLVVWNWYRIGPTVHW